MSSNPLPVRVPERPPESVPAPRPTWPSRDKKSAKFVIKVGGIIPA